MKRRVVFIFGVVLMAALAVELTVDLDGVPISGVVMGVGIEGKATVLAVSAGERQGRVKVPPIASLLSHVPALGEAGSFRAPRDGTGDWRLNTLIGRYPFTVIIAVILGVVMVRLAFSRLSRG